MSYLLQQPKPKPSLVRQRITIIAIIIHIQVSLPPFVLSHPQPQPKLPVVMSDIYGTSTYQLSVVTATVSRSPEQKKEKNDEPEYRVVSVTTTVKISS